MKAGFVIALLGVPCFFLSGPNWALAGGGLICLGLGISASLASLLLAAGVFLTARQSIWKALWMVVSPDLLVRALAGPVLLVVGVYLLGAAVGVIPITGRR